MKEVHFVHTSDWHLGFYQYNKRERYNDFSKAASDTIDKIIQINPDFVLHTGDIFHHARPTPETLREVVRILKKLEHAGIPMYIIRGNHDGKVSKYLKRGGGIISLLKDLNLLYFLDDEVKQLEDYNCTIMGVGYYPGRRVAERVDELIAENTDYILSDNFRILGIHGFVEGQIEDTHQISLKKIASVGVDYFGAGHYHIPWPDPKNKIYAPGSVETTAITDSIRPDNIDNVSLYSSFFEITTQKNGDTWNDIELKTHKIPVRPKIHLRLITDKQNVTEIRNEMELQIDNARTIISSNEILLSMQQPILNVFVQTDLDFERVGQINIEEWFHDDFLHIISHVDGKSSQAEFKVDLGQTRQKEDIILELIEQHGLDPSIHSDMISELLSAFGDYAPSRSLGTDVEQGIRDLLLEKQQKIILKQELQQIEGTEKKNTIKEIKDRESTKSKKRKKKEKVEQEVEPVVKRESIDDVAKAIGLDEFDF